MSDSHTGFTKAYEDAAKAGTDVVGNKEVGIVVKHSELIESDPFIPFRELVRDTVLAGLAGEGEKKVLDVGCATGQDLSLLAEKRENLVIYGVDLLAPQLIKARKQFPNGHFVEGNLTKGMEYSDGFFDSVQASRLFIHIPDFEEGINEMLRVLKSGGIAVFGEGDLGTQVVRSIDPKFTKCVEEMNHHMINMSANPDAAFKVFHFLRNNPLVNPDSVVIKASAYCFPKASVFPEDDHLKAYLQKLVDGKKLAEDDVNYFLSNKDKVEKKGGILLSGSIFVISCRKK